MSEKHTEIVTKEADYLTTQLLRNPGLKFERPFTREIFLMHTYVAGLEYVRGIRSLCEELNPEDKLKLIREPKNEHDELAILVKNQNGKKLGYVPRSKNEVLARLLDAGKDIYATVERTVFHKPEERYYRAMELYIDIHMKD